MGAICGCLLAGVLALESSEALGATRHVQLGDPRADLVAPVFPASTPTAQARTWLVGALALRAKGLGKLDAAASDAATLTPTDRVKLVALLATEANDIEGLEVRASSETDLTALGADAAAMVLDYHVFALVTPEVDDVISADADLAATAALSNETTAIAAAIAAEQQANRNVIGNQERLLGALEANLSRARGALGRLPGGLVRLVPSDLATALPDLASASRALVKANGALKAANSCLASIVGLLAEPQDQRPPGKATTAPSRSPDEPPTTRPLPTEGP